METTVETHIAQETARKVEINKIALGVVHLVRIATMARTNNLVWVEDRIPIKDNPTINEEEHNNKIEIKIFQIPLMDLKVDIKANMTDLQVEMAINNVTIIKIT